MIKMGVNRPFQWGFDLFGGSPGEGFRRIYMKNGGLATFDVWVFGGVFVVLRKYLGV